MKTQHFNKRYSMNHGTGVDVSLVVLLYSEDSIYYAYCSALDILGYGNTEEEARKSFEVMLSETLKDAAANGTLSALLASYGWQEFQPPKTSEMVSRSEDLADIIDNKAYRIIRQNITLPCA